MSSKDLEIIFLQPVKYYTIGPNIQAFQVSLTLKESSSLQAKPMTKRQEALAMRKTEEAAATLAAKLAPEADKLPPVLPVSSAYISSALHTQLCK